MHTSVSGVADHLATSDAHALRLAREAILDLGEASPRAAVSLPLDQPTSLTEEIDCPDSLGTCDPATHVSCRGPRVDPACRPKTYIRYAGSYRARR